MAAFLGVEEPEPEATGSMKTGLVSSTSCIVSSNLIKLVVASSNLTRLERRGESNSGSVEIFVTSGASKRVTEALCGLARAVNLVIRDDAVLFREDMILKRFRVGFHN